MKAEMGFVLKPGCSFVMKRDGWLAANPDHEIGFVSMWTVFLWFLYGAARAHRLASANREGGE